MSEIIKCVVIGDGSVGKTSLLISYFSKVFPTDYIPTVFDLYDNGPRIVINDKPYFLTTWDTAGGEDYHRLRPLCYPQTNVFLICYSIGNVHSFNNVWSYWFPELQRFLPEIPIVLVGLKKDLRDDNVIEGHVIDNSYFITYELGQRMANDIGAASFFECSAKKLSGLNDLFHTLVIVGANTPIDKIDTNGNRIQNELKKSFKKDTASFTKSNEKSNKNCIIC